MNKNIFFLILLVFAFVLPCVGCSSTNNFNSVSNQSPAINIPTVSETKSETDKITADTSKEITNTVYSWGETERLTFYPDLKSLEEKASFIFTGTCISSDPIFQNETLYTLSKVKISQVFRGNLVVGDIISVIEMGGRTTMGEYSENCIKDKKSFDTGEKIYPDDTKLVMGVDEYYPLSKDEEVLLFAGDTSGFLKDFSDPLYDIIGGYDGKLLLQKDGSYAKPEPSDTDKHEFDGTLIITAEELKIIK